MPKPEVVSAAQRRRGRRRPAEFQRPKAGGPRPKEGLRKAQGGPEQLSEAIEGQIAEICRDVAVQMKRMLQLQAQTDELRVVIREWASGQRIGADLGRRTD